MEPLETLDIARHRQEFLMEIEDNCLDDKHVPSEDYHGEEISVRVFESTPVESEFYSHTFAKVDASLFQSTMMTQNNLSQFAKKGLPEAVIKFISDRFQVSIQSSPKNPQAGDFLIGPSKAVWDRLQTAEPARTRETTERFFFDYH